MLKKISVFALVCLLFVGCTNAGEPTKEEAKANDSKVEETTTQPVTKEESKQEDKQKESKPKVDTTGKLAVADVKTEGKDGTYKVTGKVTGKPEKLYYAVEDGHNELATETEVVVKDNVFTVSLKFDKESLPTNGTITFFMYTKDGQKIKPLHTTTLQEFGS
jgi:hypothetical protein